MKKPKDIEKTRIEIDRRSFVKRAIGAGAVGSALLGATACEDFTLSDTCDNDPRTDTGAFADISDLGDRCDTD